MVAEARRRRAPAGARPAHGAARAAEPDQRRRESGGSSYDAGWYEYVDKDLRTLLGKPVAGKFSTAYCGGGSKTACAASLWASLDAAGNTLAAAQGADPAGWHSDATAERIQFAGFLSDTMRWTNRPTFQQVDDVPLAPANPATRRGGLGEPLRWSGGREALPVHARADAGAAAGARRAGGADRPPPEP